MKLLFKSFSDEEFELRYNLIIKHWESMKYSPNFIKYI